MIRKQVYLSKVQIARVKAHAKRNGLTFSEMLRRLIDSHPALPSR